MGNGNGVSRGDRNRNARLERLRELVPTSNAIVGIDLADKKQMVVVTDHDSKVLARKTFRCRAWDLGARWTGPRPRGRGGVRRRDDQLRTDRAPVAGVGAARRGTVDAVRVCAAVADLVGAAHGGSDPGQDR